MTDLTFYRAEGDGQCGGQFGELSEPGIHRKIAQDFVFGAYGSRYAGRIALNPKDAVLSSIRRIAIALLCFLQVPRLPCSLHSCAGDRVRRGRGRCVHLT